LKWFSSLPRSAWECIPTFVKAHSLLRVFELGMHSHAERGNEGCKWEREIILKRQAYNAPQIPSNWWQKRAHGARYGFSTPNDLGSLNFYEFKPF